MIEEEAVVIRFEWPQGGRVINGFWPELKRDGKNIDPLTAFKTITVPPPKPPLEVPSSEIGIYDRLYTSRFTLKLESATADNSKTDR